MHPEVGVEVGDQRACRVQAELVARGFEHRAAVRHRRGLADDDAREAADP